ncbi:MAG: Smr/MutS family protein [Rhodocyclaceae bacterium]|nr:Smr/MutS family protein [Rhodocyclaceae bacterium]
MPRSRQRACASPLDAEAIRLFRSAVADAIPLAHDRVHHEPPAPKPLPLSRWRDERAALRETLTPEPLRLALEGGDEAAYLAAGHTPKILRDLRRGRWTVEDQIDLHGLRREEALALLADFLQSCRQARRRCVRVIHGKGLGSPGRQPVLKGLALSWLSRRKEVIAFCQAPANLGGAGAVLVLLAA